MMWDGSQVELVTFFTEGYLKMTRARYTDLSSGNIRFHEYFFGGRGRVDYGVHGVAIEVNNPPVLTRASPISRVLSDLDAAVKRLEHAAADRRDRELGVDYPW